MKVTSYRPYPARPAAAVEKSAFAAAFLSEERLSAAAERMGCSIVVKQIIEVSIKNGFRTQEDWDKHFAMKDAIE